MQGYGQLSGAQLQQQAAGYAQVGQQNNAVEIEAPAIQRAAAVIAADREQLSALVVELERRISAILRPVPPQPSETGGKGQAQAHSGLAEGLFAHSDQLRLVAQHLGSLIDRIEL